MKRWELQELKTVANRYINIYCAFVYEDYVDRILEGDVEYQRCIDGWEENIFTTRVYSFKDDVVVDFHGLSKVNYSEDIRMWKLEDLEKKTPQEYIKLDDARWYALKDLIVNLNQCGIKPESVVIEHRFNRVLELKVEMKDRDGKVFEKVIIEKVNFKW